MAMRAWFCIGLHGLPNPRRIAFTVESIWIEGPKEETKFCNAEVKFHGADKITHKCKSDGQDSTYICSWELCIFPKTRRNE